LRTSSKANSSSSRIQNNFVQKTTPKSMKLKQPKITEFSYNDSNENDPNSTYCPVLEESSTSSFSWLSKPERKNSLIETVTLSSPKKTEISSNDVKCQRSEKRKLESEFSKSKVSRIDSDINETKDIQSPEKIYLSKSYDEKISCDTTIEQEKKSSNSDKPSDSDSDIFSSCSSNVESNKDNDNDDCVFVSEKKREKSLDLKYSGDIGDDTLNKLENEIEGIKEYYLDDEEDLPTIVQGARYRDCEGCRDFYRTKMIMNETVKKIRVCENDCTGHRSRVSELEKLRASLKSKPMRKNNSDNTQSDFWNIGNSKHFEEKY
jgi:hypothetical protein